MNLQIATWNIFFGNDLSTILHVIKTNKDFKNLDMFAIQEASIHDGVEDAKRIACVFGKNYDYYQVTSHVYKDMVQANAFVWNTKRVLVVKKDFINLPSASEVTLGRGEKLLKRIIPSGKRKSLVIEGIFADKTFRIYSAHFDVIGFMHKKEQLASILQDDIKRKQVALTCILGDLNTFTVFKKPTWINLHDLLQEYRFTDITKHITWTFTRKELGFRQKLDAILLKDADKNPYSSWSNPILGSDHIPLFAKIKV